MAGPLIGNLDEMVTRIPGGSVVIDADLTVTDNGFPFTDLLVQLSSSRTGESLGIHEADGELELLPDLQWGARIIVNGSDIGYIDALSTASMSFHFAAATADQVERLLRALTYTDTSAAGFTRESTIDFYLQDANNDWAEGYTRIADAVVGTELPDLFAASKVQVGAGDELDGRGGDDVLRLVDGGEFDLALMRGLTGVETIQGTAENDTIILAGSQLADVRTIEGGGATTGDILAFRGTSIDLVGKEISGFGEIQLRENGAAITLDNAASAKLVRGYQSDGDSLTLTTGFLTEAERLAIHRQGVERIVARNEDGDLIETIHDAPEIANFGEANIAAAIGNTAFLDVGRDSVLSVDSGLLQSLSLHVVPVQDASDVIDVDPFSGITFSQAAGSGMDVFVSGTMIGIVEGLGSSNVSFAFNDQATAARVQQLIRALTYTKTAGEDGEARTIVMYVQDVAQRQTMTQVTFDLGPNEAPSDLSLVGASIRENSAAGTLIGEFFAADDWSGGIAYQILGSDGTWGTTDGRFMIEGSRLKVANGVRLDYEQNRAHTITVKVTDGGGLSRQETFTISVSDVSPERVTGTAAADTIVGGAGNDVLNGGGGADRMTGGTGNDTYFVDNRSDKVVESPSGGTADLVYAKVSYTLSSYIEKLYAQGSSSISLTGNAQANTIKGNAGANRINGGSGNDTLYGGSGRDTFVFNKTPSSRSNKDKIMDWNKSYDTIQLENSVFKALKKSGTLSKSYFKIGSKAADANDHIGYNKTTGDLWYDSNGSMSGGQVVFAHIGKNKAIAYNDFVVI